MPEQIADGMYPIFRRVGAGLAATVAAGAAAAAAGTPDVGAAAGAGGAPPPAQASRSTASAAIVPGAVRRQIMVSSVAPWPRPAPRVSQTRGPGRALTRSRWPGLRR